MSENLGSLALETWDLLQPPPVPVCEEPQAAPSPPALRPPADKPVPLLLRDPLALLMHFLLLAPPNPPYLDMRKCS